MQLFDFDGFKADRLRYLENALESYLAFDDLAPAKLLESMRYACLDGGKRFRALLVFAASAIDAAHDKNASLRAAAAVEMIHAYSLVHDDMPAMDNDVLRRGKPTVHVKYGEAVALLAGDALQTCAFEVLTGDERIPAAIRANLCGILAKASGARGMAGGQAIDLLSVGHELGALDLKKMHKMKTGALIESSVLMGLACFNLPAPKSFYDELEKFAQIIGLAFQVVDDVLDATQDSQTLGKTAGKDAQDNKPTYVSLMGIDGARQMAKELGISANLSIENAQKSLIEHGQSFDETGFTALKCLTNAVIFRKN